MPHKILSSDPECGGAGGVKGVVEMTQSNLLEPFKTLEIHHALYFYL